MKILLIITRGDIGGAQTSVLNLAKAFKSRGHEVTVGLNDEEFLNDALQQAKIPSERFKWLRRTYNPLENILFSAELRNFINNHAFDVVHFNSSNALFGAIGAKFSNKKPKTVFTFRGLSFLDDNYEASPLLKWIYRTIFKILLGFIDLPVFVCQKNYDSALSMKLVENGNVIYNGIDPGGLNFLSFKESRESLQKFINADLRNKFIIGSIGRLAYQKNYEFLIDIFPEIINIKKNVRCLIIGNGPQRIKYQNLISKAGLEKYIYLVGEIEYAYKYLQAFDIFVLPSIYEGLSITLIEALFAGLPIITSNVGGNPELLNSSQYQLFQLNNKQDFLKKFEAITNDKPLREKIIAENKIQSLNFIMKSTAEKYLSIYNRQT